MIVERPFCITNGSGDSIRGDLRLPASARPEGLIIVCHGFTAHKDWGPFPFFGRSFAEGGFASIVFNFSHNGIGANFRKFTEIERFSRNTVGKELEDLRAVLDAAFGGKIEGYAGTGPVGVVGHSRGAGIAILAASVDARIRAVAAWSTIATFHRYTPHQRSEWERTGSLPLSLKSYRTKLRLGIGLLRDLEANRERYDLTAAVKRLRVPLLLVHGAEDVSVKLAEPTMLYEASDKTNTEMVVIEHAGHAFGARHPFDEKNAVVKHLADLTAEWFHRHL